MDLMAATQDISIDDHALWRVVASLEAIATYETAPVGFGSAGASRRRQMLVTLTLPVAVYAPGPAIAQTLVPEVLASFSSQDLLAAGQVFHALGSTLAPRNITRIALLNPDDLTVLDVQPVL